jgi:hypothetical protein
MAEELALAQPASSGLQNGNDISSWLGERGKSINHYVTTNYLCSYEYFLRCPESSLFFLESLLFFLDSTSCANTPQAGSDEHTREMQVKT